MWRKEDGSPLVSSESTPNSTEAASPGKTGAPGPVVSPKAAACVSQGIRIKRELVVRGRAEGKFTATERVQIWHTARVHGDIKAERISIEDGAELHGRLEAGRAAKTDAAGQQRRKSESEKAKGAQAGDERGSSGAATAGAD